MKSQCIQEDIISKVYLGANIGQEDETKLRDILAKKNRDIPIVKYILDAEKYQINTVIETE